MKTLLKMTALILIALYFTACAESGFNGPNKKKVLVIGDSISIGYFGSLNSEQDQIFFEHNYTKVDDNYNARSSTYGVQNIDEWIDNAGSVDLITLNHGIWDMHHVVYGNSIASYQANLRTIIGKIQARRIKVIFFTSTFVPKNNERYGLVEPYNAAAIQVMNQMGVRVYDLYTVSLGIKHLMVDPANEYDVHFTRAGSDEMAKSIMTWVKGEL